MLNWLCRKKSCVPKYTVNLNCNYTWRKCAQRTDLPFAKSAFAFASYHNLLVPQLTHAVFYQFCWTRTKTSLRNKINEQSRNPRVRFQLHAYSSNSIKYQTGNNMYWINFSMLLAARSYLQSRNKLLSRKNSKLNSETYTKSILKPYTNLRIIITFKI